MPLWPSTPWLYRGEKERQREGGRRMKGVRERDESRKGGREVRGEVVQKEEK